MSMYRASIESAVAEAERFLRAARVALHKLDQEAASRDEAQADREKRGIDEPRLPSGPQPYDHSFGSKETGALRRASLDLTRELAELRK